MTNEKAIKMLAKDLIKAHRTVRMVSGNANPIIYNNEKVRSAFEKSINNGVKIQMIVCELDLDKDNTIIELAKEGKIELYIPNRNKVPRNHFRVMDALSVYSEKGHTKHEQTRYCERFDNIHNIAIRFEKAFDVIMSNSEKIFDSKWWKHNNV